MKNLKFVLLVTAFAAVLANFGSNVSTVENHNSYKVKVLGAQVRDS